MLHRHPLIQITIAVASLASIGIFIHKSDIEPIATGFYRCLFSLPLLYISNKLIAAPLIKPPLTISSRKLTLLTLIGGIGLGMDMCVWNLSFNYTTMAESNLIVNLTPLLLLPVTIFYFKEKVSPLVIVPFIVAITGLYVLVFGATASHEVHITGDIMAFIAAIFYALFVVVTKIAADNGADMGKYILQVSAYCAILLLGGGIIAGEHWLPHSLWGWIDLLLLAFISQIFGQLFLAQAMKRVPLQISSVFLLLQPIFAASYGFIFFNEKLSIKQIGGAIAVLIAVYLFKRIEQLGKQIN